MLCASAGGKAEGLRPSLCTAKHPSPRGRPGAGPVSGQPQQLPAPGDQLAPSPRLRILPPPSSPTPLPGAAAPAQQGPALPHGYPAGNQEPGLRSSAEPGAEWRAPPPTPARGHPSRRRAATPISSQALLSLPGRRLQHRPPPSLVWRPQVSEKLPHPRKRAPKTRGRRWGGGVVLQLPGGGSLCPG